ncbi:hypothetical protein MTR_8g076640 [Medicago truncatula]|uniref:Uncharacterized protein n=1 Tax=Medicago truncatula TaxID=3880 RepID=A0A072TSE3_MEDTR|nr:hypothetical protein MTR_8g076640 [Medicago truncatula]
MVSQEDTLSLFEDEVDDEVKKMWHFGRWGIVMCQNEHSCKSRIRGACLHVLRGGGTGCAPPLF